MKKIVTLLLLLWAVGAVAQPADYSWNTQSANSSSKKREGYPTVSYGDEGSYITELQEMLNTYGAGLETDGIFGEATEQAVRSFQSTHGLEVDGIVGPMTWGML